MRFSKSSSKSRGNVSLSVGIAAISYNQNVANENNTPCVRQTTDLHAAKMMILLTKIADQLQIHTGPIWGLEQAYDEHHNHFAKQVVRMVAPELSAEPQ